ncbi:ribosome-recycling factor, mitochondrial isoform X1 [Mauremys reevesii]|uniref:ribosome-recycling factor, mitochondrial isoform X1 n=1 Tax=Mauremys reevesii TaxID=260615 RepID=UPI00193FE578|nr:ribosome-recycling factor, mitochondrial isoform X1 [Mauremys reevesii]XP_039362547.1 ribosome-recycling factor, mitochondrial isoform X1 [Mauremys reevesii]XP_039362548.1 ribosome-recycling factor, mitochondrial isoform X1 [Mauremys reevesii]
MAMALRWLRQLPPLLHNSSSGLVRPPLRVPLRHTALMLNGCRQCVVHQTMLTRHLATKKAKAKGKGQTQARVNINAALVEDIVSLGEVNGEMQAVVEALREEFGKNLTIRTSPGALDHITVTTKDGKFPLNQLGQISLKSPQLIIVNMASFPENTAAAIKAIRESGMNLNPEVDGIIIRVPVPKFSSPEKPSDTLSTIHKTFTHVRRVTREHRESLARHARQLTNKAKDSLRKVRSNAVNQVKKAKSTVSEDTIKLVEKQIQQMADDTAAEMDKLLAGKTKELLG